MKIHDTNEKANWHDKLLRFIWVRVESNGDGQVWAIIKSEFVILGDVQIVFPPNDFIYTRGTKVCCSHASSVLLRSIA